MHRCKRNYIIFGAMFVILANSSLASTTINQIDYKGWQGSYRMANGAVELVYVPQIGRIMHYGYVGASNMIWENQDLLGKKVDRVSAAKEWPNYGGDKLWPAPQSNWEWPPDADIDSGAATVHITTDNHLIITGQASARLGIRFSREIILDASGPGVTIENTMTNSGNKEISWSVWEVMQVNDPDRTILPLNTSGHFPKGYHLFVDEGELVSMLEVQKNEVILRRDKLQKAKIGVDSPLGWLRAEKGDIRLQVSARYESGKIYPDGGCGQEIYTNSDPLKYVELELLGPMVTLAPGKSSHLTTHWTMSRLRHVL